VQLQFYVEPDEPHLLQLLLLLLVFLLLLAGVLI
jgi:hypothetical protein